MIGHVIFHYLPSFENRCSLSMRKELLFAILRSKIYSSFDINNRPCLFPNLPRYLLICSVFREWTLIIYERRVSFRDTTIKNLSIIRYK